MIKNHYSFQVKFIALLGAVFTLVISSSPVFANQQLASDFAPTVTKIEKYPDQGLAIIHWDSPKTVLGNGEITDYAYQLITPSTTTATWKYLDLSYQEINGDFSFAFYSLARCNECIVNSIQIAAVVDGVIQSPSNPIRIWFGTFTPDFSLTDVISQKNGFTFKIKNIDGIIGLDATGKSNAIAPYSSSNIEDTYYGPYSYKLTAISGAKRLSLSGPDSQGSFSVTGLKDGQFARITIARKPTSCVVFGSSSCTLIKTASVYGRSN